MKSSFLADFKKFAMRGNVIDMAVGVIVASAFTAIVTALTNKIIINHYTILLRNIVSEMENF